MLLLIQLAVDDVCHGQVGQTIAPQVGGDDLAGHLAGRVEDRRREGAVSLVEQHADVVGPGV
jgi:hypothetical protein